MGCGCGGTCGSVQQDPGYGAQTSPAPSNGAALAVAAVAAAGLVWLVLRK